MKKLVLLLFIITVLSTSCAKIHIPSKKKITSYLEDAGYTVTSHTSIGEVEDITRIVAIKDESILDLCYDVKDSDLEKIHEYWQDNYTKSYIGGNIEGFVYYATDPTVWEISKLDTDVTD